MKSIARKSLAVCKLLVSVVTITAATIALPASDASACGGAVFYATEEGSTLEEAQAALDEGRYESAQRIAYVAARGSTDELVRERSSRIVALAAARDPKSPELSIAYAVETLREIHERKVKTTGGRSDVTSSIDLAEALAHSRSRIGRDEARAILEPLAQADLIGSEHAYAALVEIGGGLSTRLHAFGRCRSLADDRSICHRGFLPKMHIETLSRIYGVAPLFTNGVAGSMGLACLATFIAVLHRRRLATKRLERAYKAEKSRGQGTHCIGALVPKTSSSSLSAG